MKSLQGIVLLVVVAVFGAFILKPAAAPGPAKRKAVVVELFTSEGCSSCPPADELLGHMRKPASSNGVEIIPLGFHVDYWDFQGWRDRFDSHSFTERQEQYATRFHLEGPYTPQMVVDGRTEFVGNSSSRAEDAITQATAQPQRVEVQISLAGPDKLQVRAHAANSDLQGDVLLAITEDNLMSKVGAGENDGRELHHAAVVRELRMLGTLDKGQFESAISVKPAADWKINDVRYVVFVQTPGHGEILGAASLAAGR